MNVTNGVTPRRFLRLANPALATLLDETVGEAWVTDLASLEALESHADDPAFRERWRAVKAAQQGAPREARPRAHRDLDRPDPRCSTSRSSESTSTNAST
jgi:glucan phosphorylase